MKKEATKLAIRACLEACMFRAVREQLVLSEKEDLYRAANISKKFVFLAKLGLEKLQKRNLVKEFNIIFSCLEGTREVIHVVGTAQVLLPDTKEWVAFNVSGKKKR